MRARATGWPSVGRSWTLAALWGGLGPIFLASRGYRGYGLLVFGVWGFASGLTFGLMSVKGVRIDQPSWWRQGRRWPYASGIVGWLAATFLLFWLVFRDNGLPV